MPTHDNPNFYGPDNKPIVLAQDSEQPGIHTLTWDAKTAAEGDWKLTVSALDDLGRRTTAERPFSVNQTLGSLAVGGAAISFALAHAADVTVTVEKANGITVATVLAKKLAAGAQHVTWNGQPKTGYRVRVTATNAIGTVSETAPFGSRHT